MIMENIADDPNTEQCMVCKKRFPKGTIKLCRRDGWGGQMCGYGDVSGEYIYGYTGKACKECATQFTCFQCMEFECPNCRLFDKDGGEYYYNDPAIRLTLTDCCDCQKQICIWCTQRCCFCGKDWCNVCHADHAPWYECSACMEASFDKPECTQMPTFACSRCMVTSPSCPLALETTIRDLGTHEWRVCDYIGVEIGLTMGTDDIDFVLDAGCHKIVKSLQPSPAAEQESSTPP